MLILYLTQGLIIYPLLMKGQATIDVLPAIEHCDSLNHQYLAYPEQYKTEAVYDYNKLTAAFGTG